MQPKSVVHLDSYILTTRRLAFLPSKHSDEAQMETLYRDLDVHYSLYTIQRYDHGYLAGAPTATFFASHVRLDTLVDTYIDFGTGPGNTLEAIYKASKWIRMPTMS